MLHCSEKLALPSVSPIHGNPHVSAVEKARESAMTKVTWQVTADAERQRERGLLVTSQNVCEF